jgi:hypothetical protein
MKISSIKLIFYEIINNNNIDNKEEIKINNNINNKKYILIIFQ